jgi:hypothetical protein
MGSRATDVRLDSIVAQEEKKCATDFRESRNETGGPSFSRVIVDRKAIPESATDQVAASPAKPFTFLPP